MHHGDLVVARECGDGSRAFAAQLGIVECGAADFQDDLQSRPAFSSHPCMTFRFWTACPAAPFIRLSRHETMTRRCPSGASANPRSQKFVRSEYWICGSFVPKTRTHGQPT